MAVIRKSERNVELRPTESEIVERLTIERLRRRPEDAKGGVGPKLRCAFGPGVMLNESGWPRDQRLGNEAGPPRSGQLQGDVVDYVGEDVKLVPSEAASVNFEIVRRDVSTMTRRPKASEPHLDAIGYRPVFSKLVPLAPRKERPSGGVHVVRDDCFQEGE